MTSEPRARAVAPPSLRRETIGVAKAAFFVVYGAAFVALGHAHGATASAALPSEVPFASLGASDQRLYLEAREGLVEAEAVRSRTGAWPLADELAREGIAPFARDPIDRADYAWTTLRAAYVVNYVGSPRADPKRPTFVIVATEPPPGTPSDPTQKLDAVHHRLADGTLLHVGVWVGPPLRDPTRAQATMDPLRGYRLVLPTPAKGSP